VRTGLDWTAQAVNRLSARANSRVIRALTAVAGGGSRGSDRVPGNCAMTDGFLQVRRHPGHDPLIIGLTGLCRGPHLAPLRYSGAPAERLRPAAGRRVAVVRRGMVAGAGE
jgi:hypothetical protein